MCRIQQPEGYCSFRFEREKDAEASSHADAEGPCSLRAMRVGLLVCLCGIMRRLGRLGKVAAPCPHAQFAVIGGLGLDPHGSITSQIFSPGRVISNNILVANVVGHLRGNSIYFCERGWKIGHATSFL